jgi:hypothetical protein
MPEDGEKRRQDELGDTVRRRVGVNAKLSHATASGGDRDDLLRTLSLLNEGEEGASGVDHGVDCSIWRMRSR